MERITLYNQVSVPLFGLGTFMISPEDTESAVYHALKDGYRMIDTANAYLNEAAVGRGLAKAIREGIVSREDVFLSTKIWPTLYECEDAVDQTLERLGVDYVDLLFIHQPSGNFMAGYRLIEKAYREHKTRSLGISNIDGEKLSRLLAEAEIKPHVTQVETNPYRIRHEIIDTVSSYGTRVMGWYPLGHGDPDLIREPVFARIGRQHQKSPAQVILRWAVQKGFITIPGSKNPDHIRDNFNIFDFALTEEEMAAIGKLEGKKAYYQPDVDTEESYASMHLPFEK